MNYDNWKLAEPVHKENSKCLYCGESCEGSYCDSACKRADVMERT